MTFRYAIFVVLIVWKPVSCAVEETLYVAPCDIPEYFRGDFFSVDNQNELNTRIVLDRISNEVIGTEYCFNYTEIADSVDAQGRTDIKILLFNPTANCYQCFELYHRTINVLQYRHTECLSAASGQVPTVDGVCSYIMPNTDLDTMFRIEVQTVNCRDTIQGCYHFTYEVEFGGGSICDSPNSVVTACQQPGSVYVDNQVFDMQFGVCPDVLSSIDDKIRFQCMGTWQDSTGNIYSAMSNIGAVKSRDRFRCMLTRTDQEISDNSLRYTISRWASCKVLKTPYDGDIRLILSPSIYSEVPFIEPGCNFPQNFSGTYYMGGDYDNDLTINNTHIYKYVHLTQYQYLETYFICMQHADSWYLVFTIDVGKCETHFVCYDFVPRHGSILRWRLGKPLATDFSRMEEPEYMQHIFRKACAWSAFTVDRDVTSFKYNYFMLNPPQPVACPIGGRYSFTQHGRPEEFYQTRIRGITERPRHSIDCLEYTSVFQSCDDNPYKISIDAEYCATLDHTGKPISEYEIPDREMICAGYWMEDMQSYLVTYDREDPFSNFRCWAYQRTGWREIQMSRASQAYCGPDQTALSDNWESVAALRFELKESERLWDSCPQRYSTGADPFESILELYVLDSAVSITRLSINCVSVILTFSVTVLFLT